MTFHVFVAAPFADGAFVREHWVPQLERFGMECTSSWLRHAHGPEDFSRFDPARLRAFAEENDRDIHRSDVVLALARAGAGGEMFAEVRYGLALRKPVVWAGRRTLSSYRDGVTWVEDHADALSVLVALRDSVIPKLEDGAA